MLRRNMEAGLGAWTNNTCESINNVLKVRTQWRLNQLLELIEKLRNSSPASTTRQTVPWWAEASSTSILRGCGTVLRWTYGVPCPNNNVREHLPTAFVSSQHHQRRRLLTEIWWWPTNVKQGRKWWGDVLSGRRLRRLTESDTDNETEWHMDTQCIHDTVMYKLVAVYNCKYFAVVQHSFFCLKFNTA